MASSDLAAYEKHVDKLCARCVDEIAKELKRCGGAIEKQIAALAKEVKSVPIPDTMNEKELKEIPGRIDELVKKHNARLKEGLARVILRASVDVQEQSVWVGTYGIAGDMANA
jgi:copper chaperone CopZ